MNPREQIEQARTSLGIELGSTRIKACLVGEDPNDVLATGGFDWENQLIDGLWSYQLEDVWADIRAAVTALFDTTEQKYGVRPATFGAIGVSAMMHGYLAFDESDELLVPFRTWRNTNTGPATVELTELFGLNIPHRWSVAHLHQAVLDNEPHIPSVRFVTTLSGYVHWKLTGLKVIGVGDASGMFPISEGTYDAGMVTAYDARMAGSTLAAPLLSVFPEVLLAGQNSGSRTTPAGDADAGGFFAYNHLAGEPIAGTSEGRPLFVRRPESRFTLANVMRSQLYGVYATLALGQYLNERVFAGENLDVVSPDPGDVTGFGAYLARYEDGLALQRVAVDVFSAPTKSQE